jgi:hypothetical protein
MELHDFNMVVAQHVHACVCARLGLFGMGGIYILYRGHGVKELLYLRLGWIVGTFGIPSLEGLFILLGSYGMYLFNNGIDKMCLVINSSGETVFVGCETM